MAKLFWALAAPDTLLYLLLCCTVLLLLRKRYHAARYCGLFLAFCATFILIFPLGVWLIAPLENHHPRPAKLPEHIDGVILLGGSERPVHTEYRGAPQLNEAGERLITFASLANHYPHAQLIYSGGSGSLTRQAYGESEVGRMVMEKLGVDLKRIHFENESRNTYENIRNSVEKHPEILQGEWLLVTSAAHMVRAMKVCAAFNFSPTPYPTDYRSSGENLEIITWNFAQNLSLLRHAWREWLGLFAYFLSGKTESFLPSRNPL